VCQKKTKGGEFLFYVVFISSLTWRWGESLHHSPSPMTFWPGGRSEQTQACTCASSQLLQVHEGGNRHSSLTKDLQLKWSFLDSEGMDQDMGEGAVGEIRKGGAAYQAAWFLKVPNFP
jgi:hypothetical protein